jgi:futalosine hydrolase
MRVLIVSATEKEVYPIIKNIGFNPIMVGEIMFGRYNKMEIDILITGPGILATSYVLGKTFANNQGKWSLIFNVGIAGSFQKNVPIGEVVNVIYDTQADFGAEGHEEFLPASSIGLCTDNDYIFNNDIAIGNTVLDKLKKVKGTTVNTAHGNAARIQGFKKRFVPDIETMEGAAFFYAVLKEKTPCMQIRAISNYVEKRDKTKWNIDLAIENLNAVILKAIRNGF